MRVTALLPGPQYAVTSTSSWLQAAVQAAVSQLVRITRSDPVAAAAAPGGPGGPASPFGPGGPGGPAGPGGPGSPFSPAGPATPASPFGPGLPWPQLANPRASAMRSTIRFVGVFLELSMTVLDPAARPCAVTPCSARHAVQCLREGERPRRGFHRGQRSHWALWGAVGPSGNATGLWSGGRFGSRPRRADVMRIKRITLTSRMEAKQVFSSVASAASGRVTE
jgi:hypothetical protein